MNDDNQELNELLTKSDHGLLDKARSRGPRRCSSDEGDVANKTELGNLVQWTTGDNRRFIPASNTKPQLVPGVYEIMTSPSCGIYFEKIPIKTEGLLRFPQTNSERVVREIQSFWEKEDIFLEYGLTYKRGVILWGPPGGGKTCTIQLIMKDVVERRGVVIKFTNPGLFLEGMRIFREIEKETPVVILMEDIDSILDIYNESDVLNILDGVDQIQKLVFLATCFVPETRFLTADLRWVPCGDLRPGDKLWAFDESRPVGRGSRRRYCASVVLESFPAKKECVRVHMGTGESFVCTTDHPWLTYMRYEDGASTGWTQKDGTRIGWTQAVDLLNRPRVVRPFMPWKTEDSWEAGWLAGMLDGEGSIARCLGHGNPSSVTVAQNTGPTADHLAKSILSRVDAHVYIRNGSHKNQQIIDTRGGLAAALQLIGQVRANRLIGRADLSGAMMHNKFPTHVVKVEPLGVREIQSIRTTSKTYIAEGFACHNTNYPERLGARILNRPSRFDKRIKIDHPNAESRMMYFKHLIGAKKVEELNIDLKKWVKDTEKFSIAHLKELFVAVIILGDNYGEAIQTLRSMKDIISSSEDKDRLVGFCGGLPSGE